MLTPEMKIQKMMRKAIQKTQNDLYDCFSGKTKMTMAQLRNSKKTQRMNFSSRGDKE